MPRQAAPVGENKFIKGLITESTALQFPPDACTETWDCVFDETGRVTRRPGFDTEDQAVSITVPLDITDVYTEFLWKTVAGNGNTQFSVQQVGGTLYFYDTSNSSDISPNKLSFTVTLSTYIPSGSSLDPSTEACQYAAGNGDLIVVNRAIDPIFIQYDSTDNTITVTEIALKLRDFRGLNDGLDITERVTSSVSGLVSTNPAHYYNLINQGWHTGDALSQWDTARTDMPSNADIMSVYRGSANDAFDNANVTSNSGANSPAPKGHFVLDAYAPDRVTALTDEGFSSVTFSGSVVLNPFISGDAGTGIGLSTDLLAGNFGVPFDGDTNRSNSDCLTWLNPNNNRVYIGKDYGGTKRIISKANIYGSNNRGYIYYSGDFSVGITATLYGSETLPTGPTDGTALGSTTFSDTSNESGGRTIFSNDVVNDWRYVWVGFSWTNADEIFAIAQVEFFTYEVQDVATADDIFTFERPSTTDFYSGRVFYAGMQESGLNGNVYFSQIVEKTDQYGKCYQKNDPTGEEFFDLLADDGGLIKIPDAGRIVKLFTYQSALLVLATNGVWIIQGSSGGPFLATDYEVRKISSSGTNSALSVASYRAVPMWWGYEGIFTINYDPNYSSFAVTSVSDTTIKTFIGDISNDNRTYIKGSCDTEESIVYWLYNSSSSLSTSDRYKYDRVLAVNMLSGAFYPWTIGADEISVRGIIWVPAISSGAVSAIKFPATAVDSDRILLTFANAKSTTYTDWSAWADVIESNVTLTSLTKFEDLTSNESAVFDGTTAHAASACGTKTSATTFYWGCTLGTANNVTRAITYASTDQGYVNGANPTVTLNLYAKTGSAPANGTDGTLIGTTTVTDATGFSVFHEIISTDSVSTWDHVWVYVTQSGSAASMYIGEVEFHTSGATAAQEIDYSSYFTTGYRLDGQAQRFIQVSYVWVYLETETDASCYMKGVWDFTNSGSSGKWSTSQQLYNSALTYRNINHRRLKIRGKGKALQLSFESETGKPFTIIGWGLLESVSAGV